MDSFSCTLDYARGVWACARGSAVVGGQMGFGDQGD